MPDMQEKLAVDFVKYPSVGQEDWRYGFATAFVTALETRFLSKNVFLDMANATSFEIAAECLSGTDYAAMAALKSMQDIESALVEERSQTRQLFEELIDEQDYIELFRARIDFSNLRLALKRLLIEKPIGKDYLNEGNIPAEKFEEALDEENYSAFPEFVQETVEDAVLKYYETKNICAIDYAIDFSATKYFMDKSQQINNIFLIELGRMKADIENIKTMFRLKLREIDKAVGFVETGYIEYPLLLQALEMGYESIPAFFSSTPYSHLVEIGAANISKDNSFIKFESACAGYINGYLRTARQIIAGTQPIVAYLLRKEEEIKMVRMLLTGKKNLLNPTMLIDRIGDFED